MKSMKPICGSAGAMRINLNADLGESFGAWRMGADEAMLSIVDSANVACCFHAGDPLVLRKTLRAAKAAGVGVGAHPSFPDLQGFGRRYMAMAADELEAMIQFQLAAFAGMARMEGLDMVHVKPHGALNNAACDDIKLARVVAGAIKAFDPQSILLAPALSQLAAAGEEAGLKVINEIFADRAYMDNGALAPRSRPDAMIHGASASLAHVRAMLAEGALISLSGKRLPTKIGSICVHGDGPEAVATARALREGLKAEGADFCGLAMLG
jgi:UPF0271 protein